MRDNSIMTIWKLLSAFRSIRLFTALLLLASNHAFAADASPLMKEISAKIGMCQVRLPYVPDANFSKPEPGSYPQNGSIFFDDGGKSLMSRIGASIVLSCVDAKNKDFMRIQLGASFENGRWLSEDDDGHWTVPFSKNEHAAGLELHGKNSIGEAFLYSDASGDEDKRVRHMNFCLVHDGVALCGTSNVQMLRHPEIDSTQSLKTLVESIEFINP
ncbi:hypothetical protein [Robbsia sp. KACC 23696]|uniref:hypothetical protein n=1 Tax=Robbsia sp. KACC 23696 TaxID=3149231 RepID=UPI00325AB375